MAQADARQHSTLPVLSSVCREATSTPQGRSKRPRNEIGKIMEAQQRLLSYPCIRRKDEVSSVQVNEKEGPKGEERRPKEPPGSPGGLRTIRRAGSGSAKRGLSVGSPSMRQRRC